MCRVGRGFFTGFLFLMIYASSRLGGLPGAMGGLFVDGEEAAAAEDISKWSVEEVCSFISSLAGCGEYAQVRTRAGAERHTLPLPGPLNQGGCRKQRESRQGRGGGRLGLQIYRVARIRGDEFYNSAIRY